MALLNGTGGSGSARRSVMNRGAWTAEEDRKLSAYVEVHGAKRWKHLAANAGLNRCGKSCRLRWLNYLRPNIKRGNISDEEEDLILRLHKLLGNRWSLIAGRLPGRTGNEIKNYWNSHLSKKITGEEKMQEPSPQPLQDAAQPSTASPEFALAEEDRGAKGAGSSEPSFDMDDFFDFSADGLYGLGWVD